MHVKSSRLIHGYELTLMMQNHDKLFKKNLSENSATCENIYYMICMDKAFHHYT